MRRREFVTLLGGAVIWPIVARAQQQPMRRIGILTGLDEAESKARIDPLLQELQRLGWVDGRNVRIDTRVAGANTDAMRKYATELASSTPDVIVAFGTSSTDYLRQATRSVPIVFTIVTDPLGAGFVNNLARPGGNATGFMLFEYSLSGKWLELLKQIAPDMKRVGVIRDPIIGAGIGQFAVIQAMAPSLGLDVTAVNVRDRGELEQGINAFAHYPNGGLVVTAGPLSAVNRDLIITLAGTHKLPAIYFERFFATAGGLISYGPNFDDQIRQAAHYVDRIFKGEKPGDLPVQAPTKYQLVINLKSAKASDLTVPRSLLERADEVIE
jgi:putative tryptophan/tyrosine transport system substrate-binding protein